MAPAVSLFEPAAETAAVRQAEPMNLVEPSLMVEARFDGLQPDIPDVGLFESRGHLPRPGTEGAVPDPQAAHGARAAWRGMRPGLPPSPFFTPGAFTG